MIDHIKTHALVLEEAQAKFEAANKLHEPIAEEVRAIENRIAEEHAKSAKAVADFRAGLIDVGVAGIIEKTAALDIADLQKLLAPVKERFAAALAELDKAHEAVRLAAASFQAAEHKATLDTFDRDVIRVLERK